MPYLSWTEGSQLHRHALDETCVLGRDPLACTLAHPGLPALSRAHAQINRYSGIWWVRDLESANGTFLNGLPLNHPHGNALSDGDELSLAGWTLHFTVGFPGLDGVNFIERVGDLFQEVKPEPAQALTLVRGIELLYQSTENLLREMDPEAMVKGLLDESLRLLTGDRGFLVMKQPDGAWRTAYRVGDVQEGIGLSRSVLDYVDREHTAVLSNQPLGDPRFGGVSLVELHRGSLLCAPLGEDGNLRGALYLDRESEGRPFSRFDLALFQAFVRQGSLALRQAMLHRQALSQAELHGELLRLRHERQRELDHHGQLLAAFAGPLRRLQSLAEGLPGASAEAMRQEMNHLTELLEHGQRTDLPDEGALAGHPWRLEQILEDLGRRWQPLVILRGAALQFQEPPKASAWIGSGPVLSALSALVEPMFMQLASGAAVSAHWELDRGYHVLRIPFPAGLHAPIPDPWTERVLREAGIQWTWSDQLLSVLLPQGPDTQPEEPNRPLLGLVTEELNLLGLFQTVAEVSDVWLFPLEEEPPLPPLPRFRFLVVDAMGVRDPETCVRAYRHHPSFSTTPILVVRCAEDDTPKLMHAGATDWLAEGFRWEALHHRLQVLRGHTELQKRALAAERLDSFRKMAGTLKHEINNPLAIILMQVEMLQRKYPEESKLAKIEEMVDRIKALVQVLQKMLETSSEDYADGSSILKLG
ncbi:MAG TPA: FHA domain-containing protein [Holophagaceae bacterium]